MRYQLHCALPYATKYLYAGSRDELDEAKQEARQIEADLGADVNILDTKTWETL